MDELVDCVVEGQPVYVVQVKEDDVSLVAGRDTAELVAKAEPTRASLGRRAEHLAVVSQRSVSGPCVFETIEASRMDSYMFRLSEQLAPSVPMPTFTLRSSIPRTSARPLPRRMLLPGLCAIDEP